MAMGIVSGDDFEKELNNTRPKSTVKAPIAIIKNPETPGRKEGDLTVPNSLRQVIGVTAFEDGRQEAIELGRQFGISPSSVSAYSHGAKSTSTYDETPNKSIIDKSRVRIQKKAMSRLRMALDGITPAKLAEAKARDLAGIAKDMSAVVKTLEPEVERPDNTKDMPQFVVFAPQVRDERKYEVIVAKE